MRGHGGTARHRNRGAWTVFLAGSGGKQSLARPIKARTKPGRKSRAETRRALAGSCASSPDGVCHRLKPAKLSRGASACEASTCEQKRAALVWFKDGA